MKIGKKIKQQIEEYKFRRLLKKIRKMSKGNLNLFINFLRFKLNLINKKQFVLLIYNDAQMSYMQQSKNNKNQNKK